MAAIWIAFSGWSRNAQAIAEETTGTSNVMVEPSQSGTRGSDQFMRLCPRKPAPNAITASQPHSSQLGQAMDCPKTGARGAVMSATISEAAKVKSVGVTFPSARFASTKYVDHAANAPTASRSPVRLASPLSPQKSHAVDREHEWLQRADNGCVYDGGELDGAKEQHHVDGQPQAAGNRGDERSLREWLSTKRPPRRDSHEVEAESVCRNCEGS